jgi:hypothetical protein
MSDTFTDIYFQIINESQFKNKKWLKTENISSIQIFENYDHLEERLFERYSLRIKEWLYWLIIKTQITNKFIELDLWSKCSKKDPYQRGFTIHLTISNMWLSGIIQNDIEDGEKRIYFSTFLPEEPTFNKHDFKIDLPL